MLKAFFDRLRGLPPKRQRLLFVLIAALLCILGVQVLLSAFRDNIVFFYTPVELAVQHVLPHRAVRIGGLVEAESLRREGRNIEFAVTDGKARVAVQFNGVLPNLFREGQGVVAEGELQENGVLRATRILAKHDENYMPPEVAERLKKNGYWRPSK